MTKFYMGYERHYPYDILPWVEENNVPLLENAIHRWSDAKEAFLDMWEYDTDHVMDSGGYNVQASYADRWGNVTAEDDEIAKEKETHAPFYPWTVDEYHEWLQANADEIEWAATMDYACEERFDCLWNVEERIDATIENTVDLWHRERDYKLLPVLQGRSVEEYIECAERLKERGVDVSHVGLGTVCRISSSKKIVTTVEGVKESVPEIERIHGFGIKVNSFKYGADVDSSDSAAWVDKPVHGKIQTVKHEEDGWELDKEQMSDDNRLASYHTFRAYYAFVTWLANGESAVDIEKIYEDQEDMVFGNERPEDSNRKSYETLAEREE